MGCGSSELWVGMGFWGVSQVGLHIRNLAEAGMSPPWLGFGLTLSSLSVAGGKFSCLTVPAPGDAVAGGGSGLGWDLGPVAVWAGAAGVLPWSHSPLSPHSPSPSHSSPNTFPSLRGSGKSTWRH